MPLLVLLYVNKTDDVLILVDFEVMKSWCKAISHTRIINMFEE